MQFPSRALLSLILIIPAVTNASLVSRDPGNVKLSFATKINREGRGALSIIERDRAHVLQVLNSHLKQHGKRSNPVRVTTNGVIYTAEVGVGSPPTYYSLTIDTGSPDTWLGADKPYVKTITSHDTGDSISASYARGEFEGDVYTDTVTLAPDLVINQQSIVVASSSSGFSGYDGTLGLGPVDLTEGTVSGEDTLPTVMDNLRSQGKISHQMLGVYFVPFSESTGSTGELTFGDFDRSAITTLSPVYADPATMGDASRYWGIEQSIDYGEQTILSTTSGIVDTGATLIYIAKNAFRQYQSQTGATFDRATKFYRITPDQYGKLQPLVFNIGGETFVLTPNAQIWPRSLNDAIGGSDDAIYLVINDLDAVIPNAPFDFINGYKFHERYYTVYDAENKAVGFAPTMHTFAETN